MKKKKTTKDLINNAKKDKIYLNINHDIGRD